MAHAQKADTIAAGVAHAQKADTIAAGTDEPQKADTIAAVPIPHQRFADARGIAADPQGALYVADAGRHVIVKMDRDGHLIATVGGPGAREGEFDRPSAVDPTNGMALYVADAGNHRIQIFSKAFAYLGSIPLTRSDDASSARVTYRRGDDQTAGIPTGIPIGVATSGANETFAVDADRRVVVKWNENRRLAAVIGDVNAAQGALSDPIDVFAGPESLLYVADRGAGSILVYDHFGTFVRALGGGRLPDVRAVAVVGGRRVAALLPRALVLFDAQGRLARRVELRVGEDLVDLAAAPDGTLFAVGAERAYRLDVLP